MSTRRIMLVDDDGVCLAAVLKWFGARPSQAAALQTSLNDALRIFMAESQADHARQAARLVLFFRSKTSTTLPR